MVAGARYVAEKKIPGRMIGFKCLDGLCRVTVSKLALFAT